MTRIVDFTYTNQVPAMGTHLNESTYSEMIAALRDHGFRDFRTVLPVPYVRYWVPWFRMPASWVAWVERRRWLIGLLHALRYRGQCVGRLEVVLICR